MRGCRTGMILDEIKCVTPNPIAHMPLRIAKRCSAGILDKVYTAYIGGI